MLAKYEGTVMEFQQLSIDFYSGACVLQFLSGWGRVMADPEAMREYAVKFERAYTELVRLKDEGKVYDNKALSSMEALEAIRRINELIQSGVDSPQTFQHAREIHELAEQCLAAMKLDEPPAQATPPA